MKRTICILFAGFVFSSCNNHLWRMTLSDMEPNIMVGDIVFVWPADHFSNGMSTYIKRMAEPGSVKALKHFAFPIYQSGYQFILQGGTQGIKETTGVLKSNNNEMEK